MSNLAQRIRDIRYKKGLGPDALAARAEISRTALYQIECGKTEVPRAGTLRRIAHALDVPVEQLLGFWPKDEAAEVVEEQVQRLAPELEVSTQAEKEWVYQDQQAMSTYADSSRGYVNDGGREDIMHMLEEILDSRYADSVAGIIRETHKLMKNNRAQAPAQRHFSSVRYRTGR